MCGCVLCVLCLCFIVLFVIVFVFRVPFFLCVCGFLGVYLLFVYVCVLLEFCLNFFVFLCICLYAFVSAFFSVIDCLWV